MIVLKAEQIFYNILRLDFLPFKKTQRQFLVIFGRAEVIDAGNGSDYDYVIARQKRLGRGMAQAVNFFVNLGVLFNVSIGVGDIGLGLVVVVVADEIVNGIVREKFAELLVKLGGEGFVVRNDERRFADIGDDVGDSEGLARTGYAQKRLVFFAAQKPPS